MIDNGIFISAQNHKLSESLPTKSLPLDAQIGVHRFQLSLFVRNSQDDLCIDGKLYVIANPFEPRSTVYNDNLSFLKEYLHNTTGLVGASKFLLSFLNLRAFDEAGIVYDGTIHRPKESNYWTFEVNSSKLLVLVLELLNDFPDLFLGKPSAMLHAVG